MPYTGTTEKFNELYSSYSKLVTAIIGRSLRKYDPAETEDASQDVWAAAAKELDAGAELSKGWFSVVAQRTAWARREALQSSPESLDALAELEDDSDSGSSLDSILYAAQNTEVLDLALVKRVRLALEQIPPRSREVVDLRFWHRLSIAEIAGRLEISTGTVTSHLSRAYDSLRILLSPDQMKEAA